MSPLDPELRLRPAEERDARNLAALWADAFPGEPRTEVRLEALLGSTGPYGGLETCWLAEGPEGIVGAFRRYALRMVLWGQAFPVLGLAAVAVRPGARRRGVGRWLCEQALRLGRDRGDVLSALFPFRTDYYARLGYALVGALERYRFRAEDLPAFPGGEGVRSLDPEEAFTLVPELYASLLPRSHGLVVRTEAMWTGVLGGPGPVWGLPGEGGGLRGYLVAEGGRKKDPDRAILRVRELLAVDAEAYRALLGRLALQRDEWPRIGYDAVPGESFHQLLADPRIPGRANVRGLWFPSALLLRGPMLRILDLAPVLEAAGFEEGATLHVRDEQLPENDGVWIGRPDGPRRRNGAGRAGPGWPIRMVAEMFAAGALPGQAGRLREWDPVLGLRDFRLLDVF